jgi:hypothetical protein
MNAPSIQLGKQFFELSIADQGISPDQREVHRLLAVDHRQYLRDQLGSFEVGELAQYGFPAQVGQVKGITTGTAKRALLRDLN